MTNRFASLLVLVLLLGCRNGTGNPIRIGVAGPFSDAVGAPMRRAAELAVQEINQAGGVDGRPLELVAMDDAGDPDSAVRVAEALLESDVVAVIGHVYSGTTVAAAPVYASPVIPIPTITPSSSAPGLTAVGSHLFRLCPTDLEHGEALANWARQRLGFRRGGVLYLNDAYGRGVRESFVERFRAIGGELAGIYPYLGRSPDVGPYLDRLTTGDSLEFVVVAGNREEAESILQQLRARGLSQPVLGGDGLEGIEAAGPLADGVFLTAAYLPDLGTAQNGRFVQAYTSRYPEAGLPNQPAAATYDAVYLLRDVMAEGAPNRRAILRELNRIGRDLPPFQGVTGIIAFDDQGDLLRASVVMGEVRNGVVFASNPR